MKEKDKLKNAEWLLARIRPGQLLLKYFIKPSRLTVDQVAEKLKMPPQDIIEMRKITPEIALLLNHHKRPMMRGCVRTIC